MTPAMHLDREETKKLKDKTSPFYKALLQTLYYLMKLTGVKAEVIGTNDRGDLYVVDLDD